MYICITATAFVKIPISIKQLCSGYLLTSINKSLHDIEIFISVDEVNQKDELFSSVFSGVEQNFLVKSLCLQFICCTILYLFICQTPHDSFE